MVHIRFEIPNNHHFCSLSLTFCSLQFSPRQQKKKETLTLQHYCESTKKNRVKWLHLVLAFPLSLSMSWLLSFCCHLYCCRCRRCAITLYALGVLRQISLDKFQSIKIFGSKFSMFACNIRQRQHFMHTRLSRSYDLRSPFLLKSPIFFLTLFVLSY